MENLIGQRELMPRIGFSCLFELDRKRRRAREVVYFDNLHFTSTSAALFVHSWTFRGKGSTAMLRFDVRFNDLKWLAMSYL